MALRDGALPPDVLNAKFADYSNGAKVGGLSEGMGVKDLSNMVGSQRLGQLALSDVGAPAATTSGLNVSAPKGPG
jgi:hypothetical protein